MLFGEMNVFVPHSKSARMVMVPHSRVLVVVSLGSIWISIVCVGVLGRSTAVLGFELFRLFPCWVGAAGFRCISFSEGRLAGQDQTTKTLARLA
jgi:hypothetical protein